MKNFLKLVLLALIILIVSGCAGSKASNALLLGQKSSELQRALISNAKIAHENGLSTVAKNNVKGAVSASRSSTLSAYTAEKHIEDMARSAGVKP